jgi:hypothetical protein
LFFSSISSSLLSLIVCHSTHTKRIQNPTSPFNSQ